MDRYNIIGLFVFLSLFTGLITLSGIFIFPPYDNMVCVIYFCITGLITTFCLIVTFYNIIRLIKENNDRQSPLTNIENSTTIIYDS